MNRHKYSWEEETLIIDLYTRTATSDIRNDNPEIRKLCEYLQSNGYDCVLSGIRNKMENLKSVDEEYTSNGRLGRTHIGIEFKNRWNQYSEKGFIELDKDVEKARTMICTHTGGNTFEVGRPQRDGQSVFRARVLAACECMCCISGMKEQSLLQACHIKPYSKCLSDGHPEQAIDVRNGLCMNALYHKAFDSGLISIDEDMCLMLSSKITLDSKDPFFIPFEGKRILLPPRANIGKDYLNYHRKNIFVES